MKTPERKMDAYVSDSSCDSKPKARKEVIDSNSYIHKYYMEKYGSAYKGFSPQK